MMETMRQYIETTESLTIGKYKMRGYNRAKDIIYAHASIISVSILLANNFCRDVVGTVL